MRLPREAGTPPKIGEFLLCLMLPVGSHSERLGDFEEHYQTLWLPKFGKRPAECIYIVSVLQAAVGFRWAALMGAVMDAAARVWTAH